LIYKRCICGSRNIKKIMSKFDYDIISCHKCGLAYVYPIPPQKNIDSLYKDYHKDQLKSEGYIENRKIGASLLKKRFLTESKFYNIQANPRLLDIGCGLGFFLKEVEDQFEIYGLEVSPFQVSFTKELGLNVFYGTLLDANFPSNYFDAITMWEVIEHLPNPLEYIKEINRILKPYGILALSTPNFKGITSLITKDKWHLCDPKEHLFYFSYRSIKNILHGNGFIVINAVSENVNIPNILRYIKNENFYTSDIWAERKQYFKKIESNLFLRTCKKIINNVLNIAKKGDNLRIYARKISPIKKNSL